MAIRLEVYPDIKLRRFLVKILDPRGCKHWIDTKVFLQIVTRCSVGVIGLDKSDLNIVER